MTYFVRHANGQRYGPVDESELGQWAREGRLTPACQLEDAITHEVVRAFDHPTVRFALPPGTPGLAPAPGAAAANAPGQTDATLALVFGLVGILTCYGGILMGPLSVFFAYRAGQAGRSVIGLFVLGVVSTIFGLGMTAFAVWANTAGLETIQQMQRMPTN